MGPERTRRSATSGTAGELDHITVRSIEDRLSECGAVETQVGHNFGLVGPARRAWRQ
jgi:hypothetical protein